MKMHVKIIGQKPQKVLGGHSSLVYIMNSRIAGDMERDSASKNKKSVKKKTLKIVNMKKKLLT